MGVLILRVFFPVLFFFNGSGVLFVSSWHSLSISTVSLFHLFHVGEFLTFFLVTGTTVYFACILGGRDLGAVAFFLWVLLFSGSWNCRDGYLPLWKKRTDRLMDIEINILTKSVLALDVMGKCTMTHGTYL